MSKHSKKIIAPIVVTIILIVYYAAYFGVIAALIGNTALKIIFTILPLAIAALIIVVCVQRIREIKSGEEDDLDKY